MIVNGLKVMRLCVKVPYEIGYEFKRKCAVNDEKMTAAIIRFMVEYEENKENVFSYEPLKKMLKKMQKKRKEAF